MNFEFSLHLFFFSDKIVCMKQKLPIIFPTFLLTLSAIVYLYTMPPSILWIDSGTMIAASKSLGIPNPPGFPFYMMASHLFTFLPVSAMHSLQIFTIVFSLGLLFLVYKIILLLIQNDFFFYKSANNYYSSNNMRSSRKTVFTYGSNNKLPHLSAFFG